MKKDCPEFMEALEENRRLSEYHRLHACQVQLLDPGLRSRHHVRNGRDNDSCVVQSGAGMNPPIVRHVSPTPSPLNAAPNNGSLGSSDRCASSSAASRILRLTVRWMLRGFRGRSWSSNSLPNAESSHGDRTETSNKE
jgi:hypothetical protein